MIRLIADAIIFVARHMVVAFLCLGAMWLALEHWTGFGSRLRALSPVRRRRLVTGFCLLVLLIFAMVGTWYLTVDGFASEVEPVVASLSWQVQTGQALYTSFDQAERYSVLYGPSVFLTNGLFLRVLGPSLRSAKVASVLAAVGSLLFLYAAVARDRRDLLALATVAGAVLYYWAQDFSIYAVRPDALLLFTIAMGFYAAARTTRPLAIAAVAVLAGFAINLKIHCLIYFIPVIIVLARRLGRKAAAWSLAGAVAVAMAPFLFYPQISILHYLDWLANEARHGFQLHLLAQPVGYALFLALPLAVVAWLRGRKLGPLGDQGPVLVGTLPALVVGLVLSAKPGSGIVHLMPLVPSVMYSVSRLARPLLAADLPTWQRPRARAAAAAVVLTMVLAGFVSEYRAVRLVAWQIGQSPGIVEDVEQIMDRYRDLPMAMALGGEQRAYRTTWFQPLLTFRDNPVLVDAISVMDTAKSGLLLAPATYRALTEGRVALWLVPHAQAPFQKMSWYDPDVPIFPADFVRHFTECYTLRGQSRYFDLWFWNGLAQVPRPSVAARGPAASASQVR